MEWTKRLEPSDRCWTCKSCTYSNNQFLFLACGCCQAPKASQDDKVPAEVKHAVVGGGGVPLLSPGAHRRKRVYDSDRPTSPQSSAPQSNALKAVRDSGLLTLHALDLMARPVKRSKNWRVQYNYYNCTGDVILSRVLHCSRMSFTDPKQCKLSLVSVPELPHNNANERGVPMFDITLSTPKATAYNRFAIKIVQAFLIPGYVETMESHAFLLTPHSALTGNPRRTGRTKFEALINSQTDRLCAHQLPQRW
jgi:hypothetical protein